MRHGERNQRLRVPPARREGEERPVHPARGAGYSRRDRRAARGRPPGVRQRGQRGGREPPASGRQDPGHRRAAGAYRGGRRHGRAAAEVQPQVPAGVRHRGDSRPRQRQRLGPRGRAEQRQPAELLACAAGERGRLLGPAECELQHQGRVEFRDFLPSPFQLSKNTPLEK